MVAPLVAGAVGRGVAGGAARRTTARGVGGSAVPAQVRQSAVGALKSSVGQEARPHRIGNVTAFFIIATAVLFDAAQFFLNFIPVLGQVAGLFITFLAISIFGVWFLLLGVNYFSGKKAGLKMIASLGSVIAELVPLFSAFPAMTLGVVVVIIATRLEGRGAA